MGRIKALVMDQEYYENWLTNILERIQQTDVAIARSNPYINISIKRINECCSLINNNELHGEAVQYLDSESVNIEEIVEKIALCDETKDWVSILCSKIITLSNLLRYSKKQLNSENYYREKVDSLEADKERLNNELVSLSSQHGKEQKETEEHIASLNEEIKAKETALKEAKAQYERAKSQVEAQNNINTRIATSFIFLSQKSDIIVTERTRLNFMYYVYAAISAVIFICFLIVEGFLWCSILNEKYIAWPHYVRFFLPVPLCTGLLWFSIYQMNRAQRQLLNIADKLHNIKYIEGLLMAVNNLSLDANNGLSKVQNILDQVVEKYIHQYDMLSEAAIEKSLAKDKVSVDAEKFARILKDIKTIV